MILRLRIEPLMLYLVALMELVADALIVHLAELNYLEAIVVPIDLDRIAD